MASLFGDPPAAFRLPPAPFRLPPAAFRLPPSATTNRRRAETKPDSVVRWDRVAERYTHRGPFLESAMKITVLVLLGVLAPAAARAQGTVSGCVTDVGGARLPGVTVTISGQESQKQTVTNRTGCYSVTALPAGTHTVHAALLGFCPGERSVVITGTGAPMEVNFVLPVAALDSPSWAPMGARYYWDHADAVVHLRVEEPLGTGRWPAEPCGTIAGTRFRASVLSLARGGLEMPTEARDFTFLQDQRLTGEPAYRTGDEFLAFLTWNASWRMFVRLGGPPSLLRVRDGRVAASPFVDRDIDGLTVADTIARLRVPPSTVKGCVSVGTATLTPGLEGTGASIPGVLITLRGPDGQHKTATDRRGCYEFRYLGSGSYGLTAELNGFGTVKREGISPGDGETVTVDLTMSPSRMMEIDWPIPTGGLPALWNIADAVLRVRIERTSLTPGIAFAEHTARVIEVFKWPAQLSRDSSVVFRQEQWAGESTPYPIGQDLVLFLNLYRGVFLRTTGWFGAFLVQGDRIRTFRRDVAPADMKVEDFLTKLRAFAR